jgi:hypothetical protein
MSFISYRKREQAAKRKREIPSAPLDAIAVIRL